MKRPPIQRSGRRRPRAVVWGLSVCVLGLAALFVVRWPAGRQAGSGEHADAVGAAAGRLPALPSGSRDGLMPLPANIEPEAPDVRARRTLKMWREAILNRDADTVEAIDRAFAAAPRELLPALMASAESDENERVRAFSTRVIGKLRPPEARDLLRKLLSDSSQYVRYNAAWALGQIADRDAAPRLRTLARKDPSAEVRKSAAESLRLMEGG